MIYRASVPLVDPGEDPRFEELLRRNDDWVQVYWRVRTMGIEAGLRGGRMARGEWRTWEMEWRFLQESWEIFQSLPETKRASG